MSRRLLAALAAAVLTLSLTACGANNNPMGTPGASTPAGGQEVIVGSANFTESEVLAELYAGALNAKGVKSSTKTRIGSREVYLQALKDGSISAIPEYTGNLLAFVDPQNPAAKAEEIIAALPKAVGPQLAVLAASPAADQDVYVVTKSTSDGQGIKTLRDLAKIANASVLGGPAELAKRPYGPPGLASIYKVTFKEFRVYNSNAVKIKDLNDNKIQVATFFTTDTALADNPYVQLEDPEGMILPQQVIPLVRSDVAANAAAKAAMDAVSAALTTKDLIELNRQVDDQHKAAKDVAADWLKSKGLA